MVGVIVGVGVRVRVGVTVGVEEAVSVGEGVRVKVDERLAVAVRLAWVADELTVEVLRAAGRQPAKKRLIAQINAIQRRLRWRVGLCRYTLSRCNALPKCVAPAMYDEIT